MENRDPPSFFPPCSREKERERGKSRKRKKLSVIWTENKSDFLLSLKDRYRTTEKRNRTLVNLIYKQGREEREREGEKRKRRVEEEKRGENA